MSKGWWKRQISGTRKRTPRKLYEYEYIPCGGLFLQIHKRKRTANYVQSSVYLIATLTFPLQRYIYNSKPTPIVQLAMICIFLLLKYILIFPSIEIIPEKPELTPPPTMTYQPNIRVLDISGHLFSVKAARIYAPINEKTFYKSSSENKPQWPLPWGITGLSRLYESPDIRVRSKV